MDCDRSPDSFSAHSNRSAPAEYWHQAPGPNADFARRGSQYLAVLRDLAIQPGWISLVHIADPPGAVLNWIGQHIHQVNQQLNGVLIDLLDCFEPAQRPQVQVLAAPIAPQAGVDGFCNHRTNPITLMVDPGHIVPADWPGLVAHELAHAVSESSDRRGGLGQGHSERFSRAIAHLCLAQDLPLPAPDLEAQALSYWPPCRRAPQPEQFWLGQRPE
ncbi:MAG: hypothetical protein EA368_12075 [Leptolyngbya sp. DLM2.Bin27]|nr:MAG: hypothetical protein EA368_12075 [Leptolyngbya sp. DLM2.Bin27]